MREWLMVACLVGCAGSGSEGPQAGSVDPVEPVASVAEQTRVPAPAAPSGAERIEVVSSRSDTDADPAAPPPAEAGTKPKDDAPRPRPPDRGEAPSAAEPVAGSREPAAVGAAAAEPAPEVVTEQAVPEPVEAGPATYALGPAGSHVAVVVRYDRSALVAGHDHVLVAQRFSGSVTWIEGDPSACRISVRVPVRSLLVDPPGSRRRAGLEGETPDKDKSKILDNALGRSQLDASSHPDITFVSSACSAEGEQVRVRGTLTVRGVGKRVSLPMSIQATPDRFSARGTLDVQHADFDMKPFTAALGALRNDERLTFRLDFSGQPG